MSTGLSRRFQEMVDLVCQGNKKQFAELTGKSPSHVYKICRGVSKPSMKYLHDLYDAVQVDINWLLTGDKPAGDIVKLPTSDELIYAPMFDVQASAGFGSTGFEEQATDHFVFDKTWLANNLRLNSDNIAFVQVSGDSMLPTLEDGDMILVDLSVNQVQQQDIYLLHTEDGLLTKRLKTLNNGDIEVKSDNSNYETWTLSTSQEQQAYVAGKVVWVSRRV